MKTLTFAGFISILLVGILIIGGCSSSQTGLSADDQSQQAGSEIDQLFGVSDQEQTQQESPDEDEVLRLLGISKPKSEESKVQETSQTDDQLKNEISSLEKKLSEKDSQISELRSDLAQKEERISNLQSSTMTQPSTMPGTSYSSSGNFREDYQNALSVYYNRNYKLAIQLFEELLARNATSSLSDNCRYWIGESYYGLGDYNQAIIEFTKVFSYTNSNKMDDAQLKLGICYWKLGDRDRARQEFDLLLNNYPDSEYVEKARQFLARL